MKLYSEKYAGQEIVCGEHKLKFVGGVVEVEESVGKKILAEGYANIYAEKPVVKTSTEKLLTEDMQKLVDQHQLEVTGLKNSIKEKDHKIESLEKDLLEWKRLWEEAEAKLKAVTTPLQGNPATQVPEQANALQETKQEEPAPSAEAQESSAETKEEEKPLTLEEIKETLMDLSATKIIEYLKEVGLYVEEDKPERMKKDELVAYAAQKALDAQAVE